MNVKEISKTYNSRQELKMKTVRISNKNYSKGITFKSIDQIYQKLRLKYKPSQFIIIGKFFNNTGVNSKTDYITLKNKFYIADSLKYYDEDYFTSEAMDEDNINKLISTYEFFDVIITL